MKLTTASTPPSPLQLSRFAPTMLVVHYDELALKGKNREWFETMLVRNIRAALGPDDGGGVRRAFGRILVKLSPGADWRRLSSRLALVFGIAYILPVLESTPDVDALATAAADAVSGETVSRSFGVQCKRATKSFPFTSMDVQREVGARVKAATGWPVNLDNPELPIRVEIVNRQAFVGFGRIEGAGGLPTGVAGRVVCLLSGGIDSPVAAYRLLRRGALCTYAHFHSYPHTGIESQEKVKELAAKIQPPGRRSKLYLLPFAELQRRIVAECPSALRVVIYRRFMIRAAEALARRESGLALVTGESLGQVASQTLENLRTIDAVSALPILRPLIGMDKFEIIEEARRIGTFETSIEPHGDCCSFLMPPSPATHSTPAELDDAEKVFDTAAETERLVEGSTVFEVGETEGAPLENHERRD